MSNFWSRRKAAARAAEAAETDLAAAREAEVAERSEAATLAALPEAEQLARLGLPDPDAVMSGDDVAAFLVRAVPQAIRNRALRALWRSNPVLANLDGLNDYDGDFRGDGLNGGMLRTSYKVGKGLAAHVKRMAEITDELEGSGPTDQKDKERASQTLEEIELAEVPAIVRRSIRETVPDEGSVPVTPLPSPIRRMRFTFEEDAEE